MLISEISIKNFKSFGNNEQILNLNTENGELILLCGKNGNGKSSLISVFDFILYGKSRGRTKRWSTLATLPNRINRTDLITKIKFKSGGSYIEIERGVSPNILKLTENGIINERAGKTNLDDKIENYIGFDIETFRSFISMSVNDFKNFLSLTTDEKQLLLDKLFNLEVINILNGILKDINKNNKIRMASLDSEIRTLDDSINSIRISIDKVIEKEKENTQQEIDVLVEEMNSKKEEYKTLKEKVDKIKDKEDQLLKEMDIEKKQYQNTQNDIRNTQKEISLYDEGKCPTCSTDFKSEHFLNLRNTLEEKKKTHTGILETIQDNINSIKEKQIKLKGIGDKTTTLFNDLNYLLKNYKSQIDKLNIKKSRDVESVNIQEFQNTISELDIKKNVGHENVSVCKEKELYYKELNRVLGEDGAKRSIIAGIIKPINHFIGENISKMGLPFTVKLDETFTAKVNSLGTTIDPDTLSTGESKKISIAILMAYLSLIRTKQNINVLFLDEIFSSVDLEGVDTILLLLKSFADNYKVNIFVVHHAILKEEMFDRIIRINKEIFSTIEEVIHNV